MIRTIIMALILTACTPAEQSVMQAMCAVDSAAQPIAVTVVGLFEPGIAAIDNALVHPAVVAACAAVGGKPASVTPAVGCR